VTHQIPEVHGLSGDLGWNEVESKRISELNSVLLVVTTMAYFGCTWLLSGLAPLTFVASRIRRDSATGTQFRRQQIGLSD
jgi:hypothetical protein